jgi:hypothetical protein
MFLSLASSGTSFVKKRGQAFLIGQLVSVICATMVNSPVDAIMNDTKEVRTELGPVEAGNNIFERAGNGLFFYSRWLLS